MYERFRTDRCLPKWLLNGISSGLLIMAVSRVPHDYVYKGSASDTAEAINLSPACPVRLLYNHGAAFLSDVLVFLIRRCPRSPVI